MQVDDPEGEVSSSPMSNIKPSNLFAKAMQPANQEPEEPGPEESGALPEAAEAPPEDTHMSDAEEDEGPTLPKGKASNRRKKIVYKDSEDDLSLSESFVESESEASVSQREKARMEVENSFADSVHMTRSKQSTLNSILF